MLQAAKKRHFPADIRKSAILTAWGEKRKSKKRRHSLNDIAHLYSIGVEMVMAHFSDPKVDGGKILKKVFLADQ